MLQQLRFTKAVMVAFLFILIIVFLLILYWFIRLDISDLENPLPKATVIYDKNGEIASQISSSNITPVPLSEMPTYLLEAVVAVEDRRFYEHHGIDLYAIARAFFRNIKAGEIVEGGSTITQQLAKNLYLSSDKNLVRKLEEAAIAIKIDYVYSKEEILELYLNQIYFGEGRWGIHEAVELYFNKSVQELSLTESALLAGLPKAPTHYSPFKNTEKALERRDLVLSLMVDQGYISRGIYEASKKEPLLLSTEKSDNLQGKFPSYVDFVIEEAISQYGFSEEQILTWGLHIHTHLDPNVQEAIEEVYKKDTLFPKSKGDQLIQSGAVVLDPYTGGVRGLIGNRGDHLFRGFNRASQLKRQPGSTFKPLAVYAPALEEGYTPFSRLYDGELNIDGYQPKDWDGRTRGEVTLYEAIVQSWNIPAVWLLNEIGIESGINFVKKLGIPLTKNDRNLGIALGGLHEGVSPLDMAQAFGSFPNLGKMNEAHVITKITTSNHHELIKVTPKETEVMSPSTAYVMTLLMQDVVSEGTGNKAAFNRPVAGKTGTTQLPNTDEFKGIEGVKDAWFVGYTPELVGAVWLGYDQTNSSHFLTTSGGDHPAVIFRKILSKSLEGEPIVHFKSP